MNILPAMLFLLGLAFAALYEVCYRRIGKNWIIPFDKGLWAYLYWLGIGIVGVTCKILPYKPSEVVAWIPFYFVVFVHMLLCLFGESFRPCNELKSSSSRSIPSVLSGSKASDKPKADSKPSTVPIIPDLRETNHDNSKRTGET